MTRIWWFTPCLPDDPGFPQLGPHCRFTIGEEALNARPGIIPTSRLEITLESFSLDCFYWVDCRSLHPYMFVSQDLRDAMALGPRDVQYLPVNANFSAPLPRSKNYMIIQIPAVEPVSDPNKSVYLNQNTADASEKPIAPRRIAVRRDIAPKHDIFRDRFFSAFVFCTDELAVKVLQRQCSGIRFVDPECLHDPQRFRRLRGIEEKLRDAAQGVSQPVSENSGVTEGGRASDTYAHIGANGLCAGYGDRIRGVQFAAVPIPLCSLGKAKTMPANWARMGDGSLRSGAGEIITAARLLKALDPGRERDTVLTAITNFQLDPKQAADVLATRAYVWSNSFAPWNFADVPASGSSLESVSMSIMQLEFARPGTLYLALQGDRRSTSYIRMAAEEGLSDPAVAERWPANAPVALRSTGTSALAALEL